MEKKLLPPRLVQVGVVVRDLDKAIQNYREILGMEPIRIIEKSPTAPGKKYYNGKESDFYQRVALYRLGDIEYEILQPFGEASALSDFLEEHGEGIHHVAFDTGDFTAFEKHLNENGIEKIQTGPTSRHPALRWGFFDTGEKLGTMMELTNFAEVAKLEAEEAKSQR
jgi:4-hydroxyphenylpyruvate dioxygenase-like putative hemolysin